MKKGIIACVVMALVAWGGLYLVRHRPGIALPVLYVVMPMVEFASLPFQFLLARHAPQGTGGEEGSVNGNGGVYSYDPLSVGLMRVDWAEYTDEKGVKRRGPVATLALWRTDKGQPGEWKGTELRVSAGQHLQWEIFSLYIEEVSYFPEFVHFRVYKLRRSPK